MMPFMYTQSETPPYMTTANRTSSTIGPGLTAALSMRMPHVAYYTMRRLFPYSRDALVPSRERRALPRSAPARTIWRLRVHGPVGVRCPDARRLPGGAGTKRKSRTTISTGFAVARRLAVDEPEVDHDPLVSRTGNALGEDVLRDDPPRRRAAGEARALRKPLELMDAGRHRGKLEAHDVSQGVVGLDDELAVRAKPVLPSARTRSPARGGRRPRRRPR